jgi:hypothetical protein
MSAQQLTYESVLELIRENSREMREEHREFRHSLKEQGVEFDRRMRERDAAYALEKQERDAEYDRMRKELNTKISALGGRIGQIVENMLGARILDKFHALGYAVDYHTRNHFFSIKKLGIRGEIDLILHDGDVSILIEVKTTLDVADVREYIEKLKKYRIYADARWGGGDTRYVGAVAGAVVKDEAINFAHANGLYTIVQSGEGVDIVPTPEEFEAREW